MKKKCQACGLEKDISLKELYPFPEDGIVEDEPIQPLITLDCQGSKEWRAATVCHNCFHALDVDKWISADCWSRLNPITPFEHLPRLEEPKDPFSND